MVRFDHGQVVGHVDHGRNWPCSKITMVNWPWSIWPWLITTMVNYDHVQLRQWSIAHGHLWTWSIDHGRFWPWSEDHGNFRPRSVDHGQFPTMVNRSFDHGQPWYFEVSFCLPIRHFKLAISVTRISEIGLSVSRIPRIYS